MQAYVSAMLCHLCACALADVNMAASRLAMLDGSQVRAYISCTRVYRIRVYCIHVSHLCIARGFAPMYCIHVLHDLSPISPLGHCVDCARAYAPASGCCVSGWQRDLREGSEHAVPYRHKLPRQLWGAVRPGSLSRANHRLQQLCRLLAGACVVAAVCVRSVSALDDAAVGQLFTVDSRSWTGCACCYVTFVAASQVRGGSLLTVGR